MKTTKEQQGLIRKMAVELNEKNPGPAWHIMLELLDDIDELYSRLKTQEARVEMLEKALGFYADEHSWQGLVHVKVGEWKGWDGTLMANDEGKIAEQALAASRALSSPNQVEEGE